MKQDTNISKTLILGLVVCLGFIAVLGALLSQSLPSASKGMRSWFATTIHTDCPSGVQYLRGWSGAMTPRIDAEGRVMVDNVYCLATSER
jgi:hypothetical protein